nr:GTP 3',8-cyclase MoaA [Candidatus Baldrarchaeota archaeon]
MLIDPYGRPVNDIRISITQKCNLNCFYCHREGENEKTAKEMTPNEIKKIVEIAAKLGIKRVKITGGEPLVRKDVTEIIEKISNIKGIVDVSLTTNGVLLAEYAEKLRKAGLKRVNVSLDTLDPQKYQKITGHNYSKRVIEGIIKAVETGLNPVKINMVVLKGINDTEIWDMIDFSAKTNTILQLIEFIPLNTPNLSFQKHHMNLDPIEEELRKRAIKIITRKLHARKKYLLPNGAEVEIVKPFHNTVFCANCTRIRVTSDGKLKPCLMRNDNLVDILTPMRNNANNKKLEELFIKAVNLREPFYKK